MGGRTRVSTWPRCLATVPSWRPRLKLKLESPIYFLISSGRSTRQLQLRNRKSPRGPGVSVIFCNQVSPHHTPAIISLETFYRNYKLANYISSLCDWFISKEFKNQSELNLHLLKELDTYYYYIYWKQIFVHFHKLFDEINCLKRK